MARRQINKAALDLIKEFEGCKLSAYVCPAGVLTIGYGSTGPHVKKGMTITQDQADELLRSDLRRFEDGVASVIDSASDNQFGAMVALAFNIGLRGFMQSTVLRQHNAGDHPRAAQAFNLWNKAGGKVLPGLVRRRKVEAALYTAP